MLRETSQDRNPQKPFTFISYFEPNLNKSWKGNRAPCNAKGCVKAVILLEMSYFTSEITAETLETSMEFNLEYLDHLDICLQEIWQK